MAQRTFKPQSWSLLNGLITIRARILMSGTTPLLQKWQYPTPNSGTIGSYANALTSGAGASGFGATAGTEGVLSVTRTGVGLWTVKLQDNYQRLLDMRLYQSLAGGLGTIVAAHENTTITSMTASLGSVLGIALVSSTGTAADPADTTGVTLTLMLQNATEP